MFQSLFSSSDGTGAVPLSAPRHPQHPGWPEATRHVQLRSGGWIRLRPLSKGDSNNWRDMRISDREFLEPVEPTVDGTWDSAHSLGAWRATYANLTAAAKTGAIVPFAIELDSQFVGQLTLGNIQHGIVGECWIGYWVHSSVTGRGIAKAAVALGVDHAFSRVGLHRVSATFLPANPASGAVLEANGFTSEGLLRRNLHINGTWQDHMLTALVIDDFPTTAIQRLQKSGVLLG